MSFLVSESTGRAAASLWVRHHQQESQAEAGTPEMPIPWEVAETPKGDMRWGLGSQQELLCLGTKGH